VRLGKIKCAANWVGLWVALQPFLFCEGIAKRLCRNLHCRSVYVCRLMVALSGFRVADNVLQLPEGGDFEALHCQPSTNFDRSTKLDLTTEPPLLGRCCYRLAFLSVVGYNHFCVVCLCHLSSAFLSACVSGQNQMCQCGLAKN
jgi:hypothetical protein